MDAEGNAPQSEITIVIADDHQMIRTGLRMLLEAESGLTVVAEAGDVPTTLRRVLGYRPRVLVLDLNMPGEPSLPAIPRILETSPETSIVVLTMQNGALGYVLKEAADTELVQAVRLAAEGRTYLAPELGARLAAEEPKPARAPDQLSARETEVLKLIALGHTNRDVAAALNLSVRTVESHRARIQQKTGRTSRADLVAYANEHHLLD
jgi:two-component system, NarL family, response regulator NreC